MTEPLLAELEHRPEREVIDQDPTRLWHPNGTRMVIDWHFAPALWRGFGELNNLLARDVGKASDFIAEYEKAK